MTTTWRRLHSGALLAALVISACFAAAVAAQDELEAEAEVLPPGTVTFKDTETRTVAGSEIARAFSYTWPAEVAAVPALVRRFTADRAALLAEQKVDFSEGLSLADPEGCFGCNRDLARDWAVIADTSRFLVLSGSLYVYSGGAHGNTGFDALVWDRKARKAFESSKMFRSEAALQAALGAPWCAALRAERAERLGEEASAIMDEDDIFPCPPIENLQIYPASSDGQRFDRIDLLAGQYVAGSYAEGVYEVTLPVTPEVLAAVKPRYRAAFTLGK
ncbi:MAG: DUF4163 domain-containing protein [Erythrobacter sp.]|uniref:DUF4163 domain-containing protein n=1 Tax=Erythrobacter sp. TaxID=1042 RepID=UPI0025F02273|nr:DUF4163 domain-containing protein [Erythrobacter sp.]MCM0000971.1 DUF4163 domain-containing protein [Erythrobacter sp.]